MATTEVRDGRPVLVRTGGEDVRREAATLAAIAGPGAPEVVEVRDDGSVVELVRAVHPLLASIPADATAVAAQVADVLSRAHAAGIVHGPIRDEHLRGAPGAVVLDGWDAAGPGDPADDVAEVGALLERLGAGDPEARSLAARATAADRPRMAALAEALRAAAPAPPAARWRPPRSLMAGALAAATLVITGLVVTATRSDGDAAPPPAPAPTVPPTAVDPPRTTTTSAAPVEDIAVRGNLVVRAGERWTVGRPGDVVLVGDWDCDGERSPAVLRPATGQVWLFAGWAADGAPTAGRPVASVPGATSARTRAVGRCERLEVLDGEGQSTLVG